MYRNSSTEYGSVAKWFHWGLFILILVMLTVGFVLGYDLISNKALDHALVALHKQIGLIILVLMIFRGVWALNNIKPTLPAHIKPWEKLAERVVHILLYVLLIAMPLSGWIMSTASGKPPQFFGMALPLPAVPSSKILGHLFFNIHAIIAVSLIGLIFIHVAAALKHFWIDKDNVLQTMWPKIK